MKANTKMSLIVKYLIISISFLILISSCESNSKSNKFNLTHSDTIASKKRIASNLKKSESALRTDLNLALKYARLAEEESDKISDKRLKYEVNNHLGKVCFYVGLFEKSGNYWIANDSIADLIHDDFLVAKANFNLSALSIALKDFKKAEQYLTKAQPFFDRNKDNPDFFANQHSLLNNQALIFENRKRNKLAEKYFLHAIQYAQKNNYIEGQKTSMGALSSFYMFNSKEKEALTLLNQLRDLNNQSNYSSQLDATILIKLYRIHRSQGNAKEADYFLRTGNKIAGQSQSITLMREFANEMYLFEKEKGSKAAALTSKEKYDSLVKIENEEKAKRLLDTEVIKKQFENEEAELKKEISGYNLKYQITIGIVLVLLITGSFYFIRRYKQRNLFLLLQKENETLNEQITQLNIQLIEEIESKERELTTQAIKNLHKTESINDSLKKLQDNLNLLDKQSLKAEIIRLNKKINSSEVWKAFEMRFNEVNEDFFKKIEEFSPVLSINEKRLCAFLKLELTTKEITGLTGQSVRAVEIARTRLRKKLGLTQKNISLSRFLREL